MENLRERIWNFIRHQIIPRLLSLAIRHRIALPATLLLLASSAMMTLHYSVMETLQESLLQQALSTRTVSTSEGIKGPEALWTAQVPKCIKADLSTDEISRDFREKFKEKLKSTIEELAKECEKGCADKLNRKSLSIIDRPTGRILTDSRNDFLYFPLRLIPNSDSFLKTVHSSPKPPASTNEVLTAIYVSQRIGDSLSSMLETPLFAQGPINTAFSSENDKSCLGTTHRAYLDQRPVQVYFIDDYGLNRIIGRYQNRDLSSEYYSRQFAANINFALRPYYTSALAESQDELTEATGQIGKYFYVSDPYFDIAGSGLVVTIARGFSYPKLGRGAICFDLGLKTNSSGGTPISLEILDSMGSIARDATCDIPIGGTQKVKCSLGVRPNAQNIAFTRKDQKLEDQFVFELEDAITRSREKDSLFEVTGRLNVLKDDYPAFDDGGDAKGLKAIIFFIENYVLDKLSLADLRNRASSASQLLLSVPVEPPTMQEKKETAKFLVFNVDIPAFRRQTVLWGLGGLLTLLVGLGIILFVWELDSRTSREMSEALIRISKIMRHSGLPFAWLDTDDKIIRASDEFVKKLGFFSLDELFSSHPSKKFSSLIDQESLSIYVDIEGKRKKGEPVKPYSLNFVAKDKSSKLLTVVAASVPSSKGPWHSVPETFGVLLDGAVQIDEEIK